MQWQSQITHTTKGKIMSDIQHGILTAPSFGVRDKYLHSLALELAHAETEEQRKEIQSRIESYLKSVPKP